VGFSFDADLLSRAMKKTAVLVDSEWFRIMLKNSFRPPKGSPCGMARGLPAGVTADVFYRNVCLSVDTATEEIFRIFCYDSEPFSKSQTNPIDKAPLKFGPGVLGYDSRMTFFRELGAMPFVALRRGAVKARGWEIKSDKVDQLLAAGATKTAASIGASDIRFVIEQKGVDMRIGMDVASLSIKKLVDRIVLISGDTDMVPAMKLARREGVQVILTQVGSHRVSPQLIEDSDMLRRIEPIK
jgi:uncharacterized LabA/DUF88 family protein